MENKNREVTIDLKRIFSLLLSKIWIIIVAAVVAASAFGAYTVLAVDEEYTSVAMMYVQNKDVGGDNSSSSISSSDMVAASSLAKVCQDIFTSDRMLNKVEEALSEAGYKDITANNIKKMITITSTNENQVMNVTVISDDPMLSQEIASLIANNANDVYRDIVKIGSVEMISEASYSDTPSSPNVKRNILIGFIAGLVLTGVVIVVIDLLDTKVKPQENLAEMYGIPVFAEILDFDVELKGGNGYEYANKKQ